LPPARTGIALWATGVLPYFAAQHEMQLFLPQVKVQPEMEKVGRIFQYDPSAPPWGELNSADLNIYHIGNNSDFHAEILDIARFHPGIIVLHDLRLHDLFWGTYVDRRRDFQSYLEAMERWYGDGGTRAAREFIDGGKMHREAADHMAQKYPLTREIVDGALGVITHSTSALENMQELPDCPMAAFNFPHACMPNAVYDHAVLSRRQHRAPYTLLVFGHINRNRRLVPILEALAGMQERNQFRVEICGDLWDKTAITAAVGRLGLAELVFFRGHIPAEAVTRTMAEADIAINLRYPTMGEASLSQMEFWDYGLPTLVTRTGWYASLPEDAVCFVEPDREIEDIQAHLRDFLADPSRFYRMGEVGRNTLANYRPQEYAAQVVEFAQQATATAHRTAGFRVATRAGLEMRKWLHPSMSEHMLSKVSAEISGMLYGRDEDYLEVTLPQPRTSSSKLQKIIGKLGFE
jgi:glycosyltransferase involved in cell wall biosynthesis